MASFLCPEVVGRAVELDAIDRVLAQAVGGVGGLVFVAGEAGVGKSRLAREARTRGMGLGMTTLFGRASQGERPRPFSPLAEALRSGFVASPVTTVAELAPFAGALERLVPEWAGTTPTISDESPPATFGEAIVRVLGTLERGALVVLEDLQWADPETVGVVEYLGDHLHRTRAVCLATVRTGEVAEVDRWTRRLAERRSALVVDTRPLRLSDIDRMVAACLDESDVSQDVVAIVRDRAEGLPLMVEELLAALASQGTLVRDGQGAWTVHGDARARVPFTLADVVARRLNGLADEARAVLHAAAVLGRRFDWTLLATMAGLAERTVLEAVRDAVAAQLLVEEDATFAFRHALTRDAVLADISAPERQRLAGAALEAVRAAHPDLPGLWCDLAAGLADTCGDDRRAAELRLVSAQRSLERGAPASAVVSLERARAGSVGDADLETRVEECAAHAAALAGDVDRAIDLSRSVAAASGQVLDAVRQAGLDLIVARAALQAGRWADADRRARDARRLAGDDGIGAAAVAVMAQAALAEHRRADALELAAEAVEQGRRTGAVAAMCEALEVLGRDARLHDLAAAERYFDDARRLAERHGLTLWRARALHELGTIDLFTTLRTDRLEDARSAAIEAGALATLALIDLHLAAIALSRFEPDLACEAALRSADLSRGLHLATLPMALVHLAAGHALAGRSAAMEDACIEARAVAPDDLEVVTGVPGRAHALLAIRRADWRGARRSLDTAIEVLRPHADVWFPLWGLWALFHTIGDADGAAACDEAEARAGATIGVNRARLLMARAVLHGRAGDTDRATSLLADAELAAINRAETDAWAAVERLLVARDAWADNWGRPVPWVREALALFEQRGFAELAGASRAFLRGVGEPVPRRGRGDTTVPSTLAAHGVTSREVDVLGLVAARLSNKEIAARLHLSPRTVDRHVANLLVKTGVTDRRALASVAQDAGLSGP